MNLHQWTIHLKAYLNFSILIFYGSYLDQELEKFVQGPQVTELETKLFYLSMKKFKCFAISS